MAKGLFSAIACFDGPQAKKVLSHGDGIEAMHVKPLIVGFERKGQNRYHRPACGLVRRVTGDILACSKLALSKNACLP